METSEKIPSESSTLDKQETEVMKDEDSKQETEVMKDEDSKQETDSKEETDSKKEAAVSKEEANKKASKDKEDIPEKKAEVKSTEPELGISEYLGKHAGFFGIVKQRYSDFIVNEVDSAGKVVYLTDRKILPAPEIVTEMPDDLPPELTPAIIEQLEELVGIPRPARVPLVPLSKKTDDDVESKETSEAAKEVEEEKASPPKQKEQKEVEVLIDVNNVSKEGRTNIHKTVKAKYSSVTSFYKEEGDNKYIVVIKNKSGGNVPKRNNWPKSHMYTTFVLYKENIDTMDAISYLARKTGVKPNMFTYAGTKDRRAKTSQIVSVPRVSPERLCRGASFRSVHLGNFYYSATPQKLGQLRGNKFHIVLREVKEEDDVIMSAVEELKANGFINYFGSQRFGTTAVSTHTIGREILKSNWQKAVNLILAPRENDNPAINQCRVVWKETGDAGAALRELGRERESFIEGKLLMGLKDQSKDLVGALGLIPRNVRVLYLHAYQSYIWNKVVSKRIVKYGLKVLPGDIIRRKDSASPKDEDLTDRDDDDEDQNGVDNENESEKKDENKEVKHALDKSNFHFLSEEEAKTTHISDVLLPLPGYQVEFPQNEIKDWYVELLEVDGLSIAALNHRVKCYSIGGSYRKLIVQPSDISCCITHYSDLTKPLLQSDMDKLLSKSVDENLLKEGPHKAVILEMTLTSSSYATMALRELLKMDTSSAFQSTLNSSSGQDNSWGNRSWQSHGRGRHHGDRNSGGYGGRGGRYRGEKRPWRGHHGRGGKRGRY